MQVKKRVTYLAEDFELRCEPIEDTISIKETDGGFEVKYLTYDEYVDNPFDDLEGNGQFYHWKDCGREQLEKYCELLGYDIDTREQTGKEHNLAVRIDKYEHSCVYYSVHGEGMQCRWDTSNTWAVWFPDKCAMEDILRFKTKETQRKRAIELARQACELHNQWANGEVYCIVKEIFDKNKEYIDHDIFGGYFGSKYALEELKLL